MKEEDFISWMKSRPTKTAQDYELPKETKTPVRNIVERKPMVQQKPMVQKTVQQRTQIQQRPVQNTVVRTRSQFVPQPQKPVMPKPLNEAYEMIDEMKKKMESIFYRYGIVGLEKLDEALEDVIEEIMNPSPVYIEKEPEYEPPKPVIKKKPKKRRVIKKVEEKVVSEPENKEEILPPEQSYVEVEETPMSIEEQQDSLDLNDLDTILSVESNMPKHLTQAEKDSKIRMEMAQQAINAAKVGNEEIVEEETEELDETTEEYEDVVEGETNGEEEQ